MTVPLVSDEVGPPVITNHSAHPKHTLKRVAGDGRDFTCKGCKRRGSGASARYRCEHKRCDFALHTCCAMPPDTLTHPAFPGRAFLFLQGPETLQVGTGGGARGESAGRSCGACGDLVRGFFYHCLDEDLNVDLHPWCARQQEGHDAIRVDDGRVSAVGKEPAASRRPEISDDKDNHNHGRGTIRLMPFSRHRWDRRQQGGKLDGATTPENTQPMNKGVLEVHRQEVSGPGDTSGETNRGRGGGGAPVARHRSSKR